MKKTPEQIKRSEVKEVFDKILSTHQVSLSPETIEIFEGKNSDFTTAKFSFMQKTSDEEGKIVTIENAEGKGFLDCLFQGLHNHYKQDFPSLEKIKLVDLIVKPAIFKKKKSFGSDASAYTAFKVEVSKKGLVEFVYESRSLVYSGFCTALKIFEFYINCEKSFIKLQNILEDANQRNRQDIAENCKFDLSKITQMNTYEKE